MENEIITLGNPQNNGHVLYKKSNSLIQLNRFIGGNAGTSMSLLEFKLFNYSISHLDQNLAALQPVTFPIAEFWRECSITPTSEKYFTLVEEALNKLRNRSGWIVTKDKFGRSIKSLVGLIEMPEYNKEAKTCTVHFNPRLAPALLMLAENYTVFQRQDSMRLESKYGAFLYDLLCSYEYLGKQLRFPFDELAALLDATNYNRPSDFARRVIAQAVSDINTHSQIINVQYELEKTERRYSHVVFKITRLNGQCTSIPATANDAQDPAAEITQKIKLQIDYDTIAADIQAGHKNYNLQTLNLILETLVEAHVTTKKTFKINDIQMPVEKICSRFDELDMFHVEYVLDGLCDTKTVIKNPKSYVRAALFNAPTTMDVHYTAKVNSDLQKASDTGPTQRELDDEDIEAIRRVLAEPV